MVDLMMWLVIAALMLAAAIQGIGYYQQAAYAYQAKNDVMHGQEWAAARVSLESKTPDATALQEALTAGNYKLSNAPDIALIAANGGAKYCIGVRAYNVKGDNVFYSTSDDPSNIQRVSAMPVACGTPGEAAGPDAPPVDTDGDGIPNLTDPDIDGDGIPNGSDPDVDGDGIPNESDPDIDGDRIPNALDPTPYGVITGPKFTPVATGGTATVDPRVSIGAAKINTSSVTVTINIDTTGVSNLTGPFYGVSWRVTCQLPDGSQYYKYGSMWQQYTGKTPTTQTFDYSCPTTDSSKIIGYIAGPYMASPELKEPTSGNPGPVNMVSEGVLAPLFGNAASTPTSNSVFDPRFSLRNAVMSSTTLTVGAGLDLGGFPFNSNPNYGYSNRLTCKLTDNSTFYAYLGAYTSYNGASYPAPSQTFTCPASASLIGYVAGGDAGAPELKAVSGQKGPTNVLRGGEQNLTGNDTSLVPQNQSYIDPRVTVRKVTLSGSSVNVGLNIDVAGSGSGAYYGWTVRMNCQNTTTNAKRYVFSTPYTSYSAGSTPVPSFASSCAANENAIGYIVGPYLGTPELTQSNATGKGPSNVVMGGVQ